MARVALVPTGMLEWKALGPALERLFPGNTFEAVPTEDEVRSKPDMEFPISSLCSCPIETVLGRRNNADKLIERAAFEAMRDARRGQVDMVLILDDLELDNHDKASLVTEEVRAAVLRHLDKPTFRGDRDLERRTREALRGKVSFHLARPMIESWIFADPGGPTRAGVADQTPVMLAPNRDPEDLLVVHPDYVQATDAECTCWQALPSDTSQRRKARNKLRPAWVKAGDRRVRHPKAYLSWLCRNAAERNCTRYQETVGGAQALGGLDWNAVLRSPDAVPYLRALVADIAAAIGQDPTGGPVLGGLAPATSHLAQRRQPLLRNL